MVKVWSDCAFPTLKSGAQNGLSPYAEDLAVDLSPERFYTRCVKCNGQGLEHFDREMRENLGGLGTQIK